MGCLNLLHTDHKNANFEVERVYTNVNIRQIMTV